MSERQVDLFVIGAGSGGVRAARMAAAAGASVVVAEERFLGGTCVNVGCVPKKLFVHAAQFRHDVAEARGFGWNVDEPSFDWAAFKLSRDAEITRLNGVYRSLLEDAGVEIVTARARLDGPGAVVADGARYRARHVLIATGGRPRRLEIPGGDRSAVSDDVFTLEQQPARVLIAGGGYIAVELAGVFAGLGSEVTIVHRGRHLLRGFDGEIVERLEGALRGRGLELRLGAEVASIEDRPSGLRVGLTLDGPVEADFVLAAIGRRPATDDLGLEAAGVRRSPDGAIVVDAHSRTTAPGVFAIGDCTNRMNLTPVALAEAMAFVDTVYRGTPRAMDYRNVPTAVFSQPPLASVGITEEEAELRGSVNVFCAAFRPLKSTISGDPEKTLVKLLVDADDDRVLGAHMLGPDAAEIVQGRGRSRSPAGATKAAGGRDDRNPSDDRRGVRHSPASPCGRPAALKKREAGTQAPAVVPKATPPSDGSSRRSSTPSRTCACRCGTSCSRRV